MTGGCTGSRGSGSAELTMPDEPSGVAAVLAGFAITAFLLLGAFITAKDLLQWLL